MQTSQRRLSSETTILYVYGIVECVVGYIFGRSVGRSVDMRIDRLGLRVYDDAFDTDHQLEALASVQTQRTARHPAALLSIATRA